MALHTIKKGLDIPITGAPEQKISPAKPVKRVAVTAEDYVGLKPKMLVAPGDAVKRGQALIQDKRFPRVQYTAPGAGTVAAVNRGARRALLSVVIELSAGEVQGAPADSDFAVFESYKDKDPAGLNREEVQALLLESGLWTTLRARPYSTVADPDAVPAAIFVTAVDTNPLAPDPDAVYAGNEELFGKGLVALTRLTEGPIYLCKAQDSPISAAAYSGISEEEFAGPHPAGNVGTHIHMLCPVHRDKCVWHIGYQDVIAIGALVATGRLDVTRVVSLAGPAVKSPRLLKTRMGASIDELVADELKDAKTRVIAGSVLSGRDASGDMHGFLGPFHTQISVLEEGDHRALFGWMMPGFDRFSVVKAFASCLTPDKKFAFTTAMNGGRRAIVPIGVYEEVMPLDVIPTFLLRSLIAGDLERAEELGCLELDEEDVALCTFVSPSKIDYGPILRERLTEIEKEG